MQKTKTSVLHTNPYWISQFWQGSLPFIKFIIYKFPDIYRVINLKIKILAWNKIFLRLTHRYLTVYWKVHTIYFILICSLVSLLETILFNKRLSKTGYNFEILIKWRKKLASKLFACYICFLFLLLLLFLISLFSFFSCSLFLVNFFLNFNSLGITYDLINFCKDLSSVTFCHQLTLSSIMLKNDQTSPVNSFIYNVEKWPNRFSKILRCEHEKIFKVCLTSF